MRKCGSGAQTQSHTHHSVCHIQFQNNGTRRRTLTSGAETCVRMSVRSRGRNCIGNESEHLHNSVKTREIKRQHLDASILSAWIHVVDYFRLRLDIDVSWQSFHFNKCTARWLNLAIQLRSPLWVNWIDWFCPFALWTKDRPCTVLTHTHIHFDCFSSCTRIS